MNSWHKKEHLVRAVYEGIVFGHIYHIERLLQYRDKLEKTRIAGGVTKSNVWLQMFADCLQIPLEIVEVNEHGTLGTVMCAAVMTGNYHSIKEAADKMIKIESTIYPTKENSRIYKVKYMNYKKTLKRMEEVWKVGVYY